MANVHNSKEKKTKNAKKWKKKSYKTWPGRDSNLGPLDYEADALPTELLAQSRISGRNCRYFKLMYLKKLM